MDFCFERGISTLRGYVLMQSVILCFFIDNFNCFAEICFHFDIASLFLFNFVKQHNWFHCNSVLNANKTWTFPRGWILFIGPINAFQFNTCWNTHYRVRNTYCTVTEKYSIQLSKVPHSTQMHSIIFYFTTCKIYTEQLKKCGWCRKVYKHGPFLHI